MQALQSSSLESLLQSGQLWRGTPPGGHLTPGRIATANEALNLALQGGFECGQLHEVQVPRWFCGELNLLQPALDYALEQQRPVFWVNPPASPYAPGLSYAGSADSIHIVLSDLEETEALWALEVILQAGCAALVMAWNPHFSAAATRRMQRAVQGTSTLAVMMSAPMPAEARSYQTRLRAHLEKGELYWQILKRVGGWPCSLKPEPVAGWQ